MEPSISPAPPSQPVLLLGGGIHGAAVARELALNGVPVVLVDANDLATGATSKSSRLIHGGLRYLEYGDIGLVRESLIERRRLLDLAPHLVRPLRLFVPTSHRWSGLLRSVLGFFKLARTRIGRWLLSRSERKAPRGYWPVRLGLWMYDLFSWGDGLAKSRGARVEGGRGSCRAGIQIETAEQNGSAGALPSRGAMTSPPDVDPARYRWMAEYSDAQMLYPERCVFDLLADAGQAARERGVLLRVVPHARLEWFGSAVRLSAPLVPSPPLDSFPSRQAGGERIREESLTLEPSLIVNVSGAWGDITLQGIDAGTTPLFAGTKGSHLVTRHPELKAALGEGGVYAETADRRLCFVLPFGDAVLVGTTDERWSGPPDEAVACDAELDYLLSLVQTVFGLTLSRHDIVAYYSGVRPLPRTTDISNAAVSRDHSLAEHRLHGISIVTLVGGKLTTFRSVGEQIANRVLRQLGVARQTSTRERMLVGSDGFPCEPSEWPKLWQQWTTDYGTTIEEASALWPLYGMRTKDILAAVAPKPLAVVTDTPFATRTVRWVIDHEWVTTLDDLIERRLMLVFAPRLSLATLHDLANCLVESGRLSAEAVSIAIAATRERLRIHYGRVLE